MSTNYVPPRTAATRLGVSTKTLDRWLVEGKIEAIATPGGQRRYDLDSIIDPKLVWRKNQSDIPKDKESGLPLITIESSDLSWDSVVLPNEKLEVLQRVTLENRKQDLLESHGLRPKSKLLFCGPPGCGKTLTAKVLSGVLGIPLVYVNLAAVFSSYLGETATNLKKIFDYVEKGEWVVLFDEFDAIARDRDTFNEHGEVKRLVNSLLQLIDTSNSNSLFIAATNHQSLLDNAVWRRFDEVVFFEEPNLELRTNLLKRYLSRIRHSINLEEIAASLNGATGADIERICSDGIKTVILRGDREMTYEDLKTAVDCHFRRIQTIQVGS